MLFRNDYKKINFWGIFEGLKKYLFFLFGRKQIASIQNTLWLHFKLTYYK